VAKVEYYPVIVRNKPGKGVHVLEALKEAGVNFTAVWGYPVGKSNARLDLVAADPALLKKAAKKLGLELGAKQIGFYVTGEDRPGAVAEVLAKLAAKEINVFAVQAMLAGGGQFGVLIQVGEKDVKKAAKILA